MKAKEFIQRFSVQSRLLCGGPLDGIKLHTCKAGERWYGAVQDTHEGWCYVVPVAHQPAATAFLFCDADLVDALQVAA